MRIVRYALVGGTAALLDFTIFAVFAKWLGFSYLWVGSVAFVFATMVNYLLSIRHVFESGVRFSPRKEVAMVFLVSKSPTQSVAGLRDQFFPLVRELGWEAALNQSSGLPSTQAFYEAFEAFMKQSPQD